MKLYKNNISQKILLLVSVFSTLVVLLGVGRAFAAVPTDYNKNYEYTIINGKCGDGDFVEYTSIVPNSDPAKVKGVNPFACLRLKKSDPKGYTASILVTNQPLIDNCNPGLNGSQGHDEYHLVQPLAWACIKVTDPKLWDKSDYTNSGNTDTTCAKLGTDGSCIQRATDATALGQCGSNSDATQQCGLIDKYINPLIRLLSGAIGLLVVIMIIVGGIQYSTAGGDPSKVAAAKKRIFNAVFALVIFMLFFAILNWLIPGGVL